MSRDHGVIGTGVLHGGKVEWDDPRGFTDDLKMMGDGSVIVRVDLATQKAVRSVKANRYYRGVVLPRIAAVAEGNTPDDIHDAMCERFLGRKVFLVNKQTGEVREHEVAGRSSKLPPDEFFAFVEQVRQFAAEFFGISIPDPDPAYRLNRTEAA